MIDIKGVDIVAAIAIPCFSALVYLGHDGAIITLISTIIGVYFGHKATTKPEETG